MAKDKAVQVDEFDLPIPTEQVESVYDAELPTADDDVLPIMSAEEDVPEIPGVE